MTFNEILDKMIETNSSDVFIRVGSSLRGRINTFVKILSEERFTVEGVQNIVKEMCPAREQENLKLNSSAEFALWYKDFWRFRIGIFYQRDSIAMVIRKIDLRVPTFEELALPAEVLKKFCEERRGMILLTGITGSGKSTTIASMIEYINQNFERHILTVEEPVEFTFKDKKSIINQREVGRDVKTYSDALRQFALHSPDVIYIGLIRDAETCYAALTAAETGVLVLSTMHTVNASATVERIINFFPPHHQHLLLTQLSTLLKGVVSQRLMPKADGSGLIPAIEILTLSPSVARLLRENKLWEIPKYMTAGDVYGMKSFHQCLMELIEKEIITPKIALEYADKKEELEMELRNKSLI